MNGNTWTTQNSNDMVYAGITDAAQRASVALETTGEVQAAWNFVSGFTPVEPTGTP